MPRKKSCSCNPRLGYKVCRSGKKFVHHKNQKCRKVREPKRKHALPILPTMEPFPKY
jgi:hypothetical protein